MTMDWTDDQIFNDLEPFGGGGRKNQNPVPEESGSMDYIEELDRLLGPDVWRENFPAEFRNLGKPDAGTMVSRQSRLEPETGNESEAEAAPTSLPFLPSPPQPTAMDEDVGPDEEEVLNEDSSDVPGTWILMLALIFVFTHLQIQVLLMSLLKPSSIR